MWNTIKQFLNDIGLGEKNTFDQSAFLNNAEAQNLLRSEKQSNTPSGCKNCKNCRKGDNIEVPEEAVLATVFVPEKKVDTK